MQAPQVGEPYTVGEVLPPVLQATEEVSSGHEANYGQAEHNAPYSSHQQTSKYKVPFQSILKKEHSAFKLHSSVEQELNEPNFNYSEFEPNFGPTFAPVHNSYAQNNEENFLVSNHQNINYFPSDLHKTNLVQPLSYSTAEQQEDDYAIPISQPEPEPNEYFTPKFTPSIIDHHQAFNNVPNTYIQQLSYPTGRFEPGEQYGATHLPKKQQEEYKMSSIEQNSHLSHSSITYKDHSEKPFASISPHIKEDPFDNSINYHPLENNEKDVRVKLHSENGLTSLGIPQSFQHIYSTSIDDLNAPNSGVEPSQVSGSFFEKFKVGEFSPKDVHTFPTQRLSKNKIPSAFKVHPYGPDYQQISSLQEQGGAVPQTVRSPFKFNNLGRDDFNYQYISYPAGVEQSAKAKNWITDGLNNEVYRPGVSQANPLKFQESLNVNIAAPTTSEYSSVTASQNTDLTSSYITQTMQNGNFNGYGAASRQIKGN